MDEGQNYRSPQSFKSVVIEGGDQIGKGDVTNYLLERFKRENVNICKLSFPLYSAPFGTIVRKTLEKGFPSIPEIDLIAGTRRELEIKMVLFAINRLEALESILRRYEEKEMNFMLDRSPYSHAVTISYGLQGVKCVSEEEVDDLIGLIFDIEEFFIKTLNLSDCVIHLMADHGRKGWKKERSDGDLYEVRAVQEVVDSVYKKIGGIVGQGWGHIYTKKNAKFRSREDIYKEVDLVVDALSFKSTKGEGSVIYDILEVAKDVYGLDLYGLSIYEKYFRNVQLDDNEKNRETYGLACEIGEYIAKTCTVVVFENKGVKKSIKRILKLYPEVLSIVEYHFGETFRSKFESVLDE